MNTLTPYLFFNGNCREAMNFYKQCFGGELQLCTYGEAPVDMSEKNAKSDEIMHSYLMKDSFNLMASDWPNSEAEMGNNVHLGIDCANKEETNSLFAKLSKDGKVVQDLQETFWGSYFGMLVDKYGIHWMLSCPLQQK